MILVMETATTGAAKFRNIASIANTTKATNVGARSGADTNAAYMKIATAIGVNRLRSVGSG
jgi:hypothetical protein